MTKTLSVGKINKKTQQTLCHEVKSIGQRTQLDLIFNGRKPISNVEKTKMMSDHISVYQ